VASKGGAMGAVIDAGEVKGGVGGGMGGARAVGGGRCLHQIFCRVFFLVDFVCRLGYSFFI
jgi:hypothetical protein